LDLWNHYDEDERRAAVNLRLDLRVDDAYVPDMNQRLMVYRRLASARTDAEVTSAMEEMRDRYGPPPPSVENLAQYARLRLLADRIGVESLDREGTTVAIRFRQDAKVHPGVLARLLQTRGDLAFVPPVVLRLDLTRPAAAPKPALVPQPPRPKPQPPSRLVPASKKTIVEDDSTADSWWTARATAKVEPGFTRNEILAEAPMDPSAAGGLFDRLTDVLGQLSQSLVTG